MRPEEERPGGAGQQNPKTRPQRKQAVSFMHPSISVMRGSKKVLNLFGTLIVKKLSGDKFLKSKMRAKFSSEGENKRPIIEILQLSNHQGTKHNLKSDSPHAPSPPQPENSHSRAGPR